MGTTRAFFGSRYQKNAVIVLITCNHFHFLVASDCGALDGHSPVYVVCEFGAAVTLRIFVAFYNYLMNSR